MSDTTYNGWTNYPTWCVNLWLDNDQYSQEDSHRTVVEAYKTALQAARINQYIAERSDDDHRAYARSDAADVLKSYVEEILNDDRADMGSDLQSWALGQVNWHELVTTWLEDEDLTEDDDEEDAD